MLTGPRKYIGEVAEGDSGGLILLLFTSSDSIDARTIFVLMFDPVKVNGYLLNQLP